MPMLDKDNITQVSDSEIIITVEGNENDQEDSTNQMKMNEQQNILDKYIEKNNEENKPNISRIFFASVFGIILGIVVFAIGLIVINSDKILSLTSEMRCVPQECHGLKFTCGYKVPKCDDKYVIGDRCRKYAKCGFYEGKCTEIFMDKFYACRQCVEECKKKYIEDIAELNACEMECDMGKGF